MESIRAIPIRSVAVALGFSLTAKGTGRCRLPGHEDRNPSFAVRSVTNRFICYACGGRGDVIDLVMIMENLDFVGACTWLQDGHLGGPSSNAVRRRTISRIEHAPARRPVDGPKIATAADREVFNWLVECSPLGGAGAAYMRSRCFSDATTRHFGVGQVGDRTLVLRDAVARFGAERLRRCGLICDGRFGDRLVFPTGYLIFPFTVDGEVVYLQARRPDDDPRWRWLCLNGLQPSVYNHDVLLGDSQTISICEGATDVLSAHELGIVAIGLAGANAQLDAVTLERLRGRNVAVFGDGDGPGARFARELVSLLSTKGITAIPKRLPKGVNDLNDHLRRTRSSA